MRFAKGHGTGNDFVILPDVDNQFVLTPELVRGLCDRHKGIGADGVLRVVAGQAFGYEAAPWFMDYWNADGGIAEMCGNGIRVFARYLVQAGLAAGLELAIGTRAGVRRVVCEANGLFSVDMGPATITGKGTAEIGGPSYTLLAIGAGNPLLASVADEPVPALELSSPPGRMSPRLPATSKSMPP